MIGGYAVVAVGSVVALAAIPGAPAAVASFMLGNSLPGAAFALTDLGVGLATGTSITEWAIDKGVSTAVKGISVEVPNYIVVSSLEHAQELGCAMDNGG